MGPSLRARGVSLVELILALAIVAIAIIALVTLFISGLKLLGRSADVQRSSEIARETVEAIVDMGHAQAPSAASVFDGRNNDPQDANGFPPAPYPTANVEGRLYPITVSVEPLGSLKVVQVRVHYAAGGNLWLERYLHP